jgi:putative ubiquitin-RnfH superfamily antitoxin RatB of RatAB toxin-antitoxin module
MRNELIAVEVAYATPSEQQIIAIEIKAGATVEQVIAQSKLLGTFLEINLSTNKVGIFGQVVELNQVLQRGDRVEIYRPLQVDPRLARRERVLQTTK